MEFFEKAFDWMADVSSRLPQINFKAYFIVVLAILFGVGVIFAFTYLGSRSAKLTRSSKKIQKYLDGVDVVNDDNVSEFTEQCFSQCAPQPLRDSWVQYLGVRFGYPSDIVSDKNVYDKIVKKNKDYRSAIYLVVSLVLLGVFAFWGYGTLDAISMSVIHLLGLVLIAIVYLVLNIIHRKQNKSCLDTFYNMQEDLDAKVNLQVEKNFATDSSPLFDLVGMVEEIVARNSSKEIELEEVNVVEPTPIETLIELEEQSESVLEQMPARDGEDGESVVEQEIPLEEVVEQEVETIEQVQEVEQEIEEQQEQQEPCDAVEEVVEEQVDDTPIDNVEWQEEPVQYVEDNVEDNVEDPEDVCDMPVEEVEQEPVQEYEEEVADLFPEDEVEEVEVQEDGEQQDDGEEYIEETVQEEELFADVEQDDEIENIEEEIDGVEDFDESQEIEEESAEEQEDPEQESIEEDVEPTFDEDSDNATEYAEDEIVDDVDSDNDVDSDDVADEEEAEQDEPEVVYVVDGEDDDDEVVKPAKLVKLPNLVDYMLTKNMPKSMKIQIATMLISAYKKFENSKEDRKIVVHCLTKVMRNLQEN